MLVGHIFEILVSFWVVGGRLGACWQLEGVIGAFGSLQIPRQMPPGIPRVEVKRGGADICSTDQLFERSLKEIKRK